MVYTDRINQIYVFTTMEAKGESWDPVKLAKKVREKSRE